MLKQINYITENNNTMINTSSCDHCACYLEEQEDINNTRLTCKYTGPEEHDPNYDYDSLQAKNTVYSRCYDWDPKPEFDDEKPLFREHCDVQNNQLQNNQLQNNQVQNNDTLPNTIEELYEYLEKNEFVKDSKKYEQYKDEDEIDYDNFYTKKALCVTCGEVNYAELVYEADAHPRMVCCDCIEKINCCDECNIVTLEHLFHKSNEAKDLCFDCYFKKPLKEQIPIEAHLLIRRDIQQLRKNHFDILVDYAELANMTIFEAYRYKSTCHFYCCTKTIEPHGWNSEETLNFCSNIHCEYAEELGCHCQYVYDGKIDYDEYYEEVTCKICNSPHEENVTSRKALRNSSQGFKSIVSAICAFNEGIKMSNVLSESLVDLCQYFK